MNLLHTCEYDHWCSGKVPGPTVAYPLNDTGICSNCGAVPPDIIKLATALEIKACYPPID